MKMRKLESFMVFLPLSFFAFSCATTGKSTASGAVAGGLLGAGVGAIADPGEGGRNRFRNVVIGTAVGAAAGAATGLMFGESMKDERDDARSQGRKEAMDTKSTSRTGNSGEPPTLIPPRTEARWIPDQVHGNTFIPAHFEYSIVEGAQWQIPR
jgi:hypothetical protein